MNKSLFALLTFIILGDIVASAQVSQIDRTRIPSDPAIQKAYDDLITLNPFSRTYESRWRFSTPQDQVAARLTQDLNSLEAALRSQPSNTELQLLTGLAAHLAYNLDDQKAYEPAMRLLGQLAPQDFRAAWFLGVHQCQSNDTIGGMRHLLAVEASQAKLPADFWQDYANCASVTFMPAHAVRAYDLADSLNDGVPADPQLEQIARNRITPASNSTTYTNQQAWYADNNGSTVRFISTLCGESFTTKDNAHLELSSVDKGTCTAIVDGEPYPTRKGKSGASFALVSKPGAPGQTLQEFAHGFLDKPAYASATQLANYPCPISPCLAYEIVTDKLYAEQGGAHLIAVFFASEPPAYPGLRFELAPIPLPTPDKKSKGPGFYRPSETLGRLPGTRFTAALLDANADIYGKSRADFDAWLHTLILDSK